MESKYPAHHPTPIHEVSRGGMESRLRGPEIGEGPFWGANPGTFVAGTAEMKVIAPVVSGRPSRSRKPGQDSYEAAKQQQHASESWIDRPPTFVEIAPHGRYIGSRKKGRKEAARVLTPLSRSRESVQHSCPILP